MILARTSGRVNAQASYTMALRSKSSVPPRRAKAELMAVLPAAVSKRIVWDTLRQESASYIDRNLRQSHSDLVFSAKFRVGRRWA